MGPENLFAHAHHGFLDDVEARDPEHRPFEDFDHPFFQADEVEYKDAVYVSARRALQRDRWDEWRDEPGRITGAVVRATMESENLLEMRYGDKGNSGRALYMTQKEGTEAERAALDAELVHLFDGPTHPDAFGPRFDRFADYLRDHRLGCPWDFLAFLAFIADDEQRYVPIKSGPFQAALRYYGDETPLMGRVTWEGYEAVLRLVDIVGRWLEPRYGPLRPIEIQSYLWIVARCVLPRFDGRVSVPKKRKEWATELARREAEARRRERTGLKGERFCYERERRRLTEADRGTLAGDVELVSITGTASGYDLLTFETDGTERHVEIKTTTERRDSGYGFWLSESERRHAERDPAWRLWRVWDIDGDPEVEDLGNVVTSSSGWSSEPASWRYAPTRDAGNGES